jgi:hypothetical protein
MSGSETNRNSILYSPPITFRLLLAICVFIRLYILATDGSPQLLSAMPSTGTSMLRAAR